MSVHLANLKEFFLQDVFPCFCLTLYFVPKSLSFPSELTQILEISLTVELRISPVGTFLFAFHPAPDET